MVKRVLLHLCGIDDRRKNVKSSVFFEHAVGTERHAIHNVTAHDAIGRRKFNVSCFGKLKVVVDKERHKTVYKKTKKDEYRNDSRLPYVSEWRKLACHKHLLANKTARILRKRRNGVLQLFDEQAIKVIDAVREPAPVKDLDKQKRLIDRRNVDGAVLARKRNGLELFATEHNTDLARRVKRGNAQYGQRSCVQIGPEGTDFGNNGSIAMAKYKIFALDACLVSSHQATYFVSIIRINCIIAHI